MVGSGVQRGGEMGFAREVIGDDDDDLLKSQHLLQATE
jgi:hypothetical protein